MQVAGTVIANHSLKKTFKDLNIVKFARSDVHILNPASSQFDFTAFVPHASLIFCSGPWLFSWCNIFIRFLSGHCFGHF